MKLVPMFKVAASVPTAACCATSTPRATGTVLPDEPIDRQHTRSRDPGRGRMRGSGGRDVASVPAEQDRWPWLGAAVPGR